MSGTAHSPRYECSSPGDSTTTRFWKKVIKTETCWIWTAYLNRGGYGQFRLAENGRLILAHRWAYEHERGPVPHGLQIDHLCRQRACVRPDHMEPVTQRENILRGTGFSARNARLTHCVHGHDLSNSYRSSGSRQCRVCVLARQQTPEQLIARRNRDKTRKENRKCEIDEPSPETPTLDELRNVKHGGPA
jgi:HNH endonuclease